MFFRIAVTLGLLGGCACASTNVVDSSQALTLQKSELLPISQAIKNQLNPLKGKSLTDLPTITLSNPMFDKLAEAIAKDRRVCAIPLKEAPKDHFSYADKLKSANSKIDPGALHRASVQPCR